MALLNLSVISFFTPAVLAVLALPSAAQGQKGLVLPLQEATQIAQSGDSSKQLK